MVLYFDIGANIGNWTAENINNADKIISIEPSINTFNSLKNRFSSVEKIECINYAICNNDNKNIDFFECEYNTLSSLNDDWFVNPKSRFYGVKNIKTECKSLTLDSLIDIYGIPDLVKIDVECGEYMCISSLNIKIPLLCFEWASEYNDITLKCLEHLNNLGYSSYYIQDDDSHLFRPNENDYYSIELIIDKLKTKIDKVNWGMIWCK
jgi:FkbM family methyltransferase